MPATLHALILTCDDCLMSVAGITVEEMGHVPDIEPMCVWADETGLTFVPSHPAGFMWRRCDGCGTQAAGTRTEVDVLCTHDDCSTEAALDAVFGPA